jgi:Peptidase MA superfamily
MRIFSGIFAVFVINLCAADQLQFEGPAPPDVDKSAMTAEYYRLYRALAPRQRPDNRPVRIVYLKPKESAVQEYGLPEWGGGGAIGRDLIVVPTAARPFLDQSLAQVTRHELVHIVLNRAYPSCAVPRWFHEGVAMTLSGELSLEENVIVSRAIFTNSLLALSSIDSVNAFGRNRADLAYSQSHLAVLFLIDQYGLDVLSDVLISARKTGAFWKGIDAILSLTPQEFELAAREYVTARYKLVFLFADYPAFWVAIVLLFLVASGVAFVRKRKSLDAMERAEQLEADGPGPGETTDGGPIAPTAPQPPTEQSEESRLADDNESWDDDGDDDYVLGDDIELEDDDKEEGKSL